MGWRQDEKVVVMCQSTQAPFAHPCNGRWLLQEGRATFSQLICLAVFCLAGLQGLKFMASWYDNWQLEEAMQAVVNDTSFSTDAGMINAVLAKAQKLKVPLAPRNLHIERSSHGGTRLWAAYEVIVTFPLGFSQTYNFHPEVRSSRR
jgi:hypothetical protein